MKQFCISQYNYTDQGFFLFFSFPSRIQVESSQEDIQVTEISCLEEFWLVHQRKGNSEGRQVLTIHICLLIQYPLELCLNLESILLKKQNRFSSRLLYLKLCLSFQYKNIITNRRRMLFCLILTVSLQGSYQYPYFRKENMETLRIYINFQD